MEPVSSMGFGEVNSHTCHVGLDRHPQKNGEGHEDAEVVAAACEALQPWELLDGIRHHVLELILGLIRHIVTALWPAAALLRHGWSGIRGVGDGVDLNGAWTALELLSCGKQTSERHRAQPSQFSPPPPNVYGLSIPLVWGWANILWQNYHSNYQRRMMARRQGQAPTGCPLARINGGKRHRNAL